ncbi:MAG: glycosyltransferase family 4 protein [Acidobacteria bacterium]|nr:glycosyltransferase family 4 protein [Acidobacteriota bacterium]
MRGGEKVLELLCQAYPGADLLTLFHVPGSVSPAIERLRPRTSWLQHLPGARRFYRYFLPLFPTAIEQFDLDAYDLVISTSHCAAKAVVKTGRARHLCYCFTPMRYAWDQFDVYFGEERVGKLANRLLRPVMRALARWDAATAGRVDRYVAISQHVASRIRRYYNRDAVVIYPPVDTTFYCPAGDAEMVVPEDFLLIVSALVPYKRIDVAIEASRLSGVPLRIVGDGPEREALTRLAAAGSGSDVQLLGALSDVEVRDLYRRASAVLLPGEEDFGIVPVEAQACGRPVVALARGGALETVIDNETGVLVSEPTPAAFAAGIARVRAIAFDAGVIRRHALKFDRAVFERSIQSAIESLAHA